MKVSKTEKLHRAFKTGQQLSAGQIKARFKLLNPRAAVSNIRIRYGTNIILNGAKYSMTNG